MVKDWTPKRREQLRELQTILTNMECINRTTAAIDYIQSCSNSSKALLATDFENGEPCFWVFLIEQINKE
jgi:hypothetical protein